jgi:hydroxyacylglutathione hydrolase
VINIKPLKAYTDNYIWLLETNEEVSVVDPGDAKPVLDYLRKTNKNLKDILITHHHFDHTAGVPELENIISGSIYGPKDSYELIKEKVAQGDTISSLGIKFQIIEVPGHTLDHIAFYSEEYNILFCGDTLFAGGCGRVFEGTFDQMFESLNKLKQLPDSTQIYCGHEYTKSNLLFSVEVEPENNDLIMRNTKIDNLLLENGSSLPSSIELEKKTNPFLRCDVLSDNIQVIQKFGLSNPSEKEIFKYIREWKDST